MSLPAIPKEDRLSLSLRLPVSGADAGREVLLASFTDTVWPVEQVLPVLLVPTTDAQDLVDFLSLGACEQGEERGMEEEDEEAELD